MHIILSRTDSIGDVVLTLPMAGILKQKYPAVKITFAGRSYTEAVVRLSAHVDEFLNVDDLDKLTQKEQIVLIRSLQSDWFIHVFPNRKLAVLAKKAGIANRVGTSHRTFHWLTCNYRPNFSRKNSDLHEAQLNCRLLSPLGIELPGTDDLQKSYGFRVNEKGLNKINTLLDSKRKNIILHPKSKGSAREWGLGNFGKLVELLPPEKFSIFISGTDTEAELIQEFLEKYRSRVVDVTGKFSLAEFITFIAMADALVAASTGPLHLAAALGKNAVGIYPPIRPMHPGRWKPLGPKAKVLVLDKVCNECRKTMKCTCMQQIQAAQVAKLLEEI